MPKIILQPIGTISTPYTNKYRAPRQPGLADPVIQNPVGIIRLLPKMNFEQAVEDLSEFERIWIISWFDQAPGWKPKVLPPRSGRTKRGLFATRSPHRPNPVGISVCRLLAVDGLTLTVEAPDLLDGTPILDLKPYIPYADAFPKSAAGWTDSLSQTKYTVAYSQKAGEQFDFLEKHHAIDLRSDLLPLLAADPLPHPYRRVKKREDGLYVVARKSWRVVYSCIGANVTIIEIKSGYSPETVKKGSVSDAPEAHRAFYEKWGG